MDKDYFVINSLYMKVVISKLITNELKKNGKDIDVQVGDVNAVHEGEELVLAIKDLTIKTNEEELSKIFHI